MVNWKKKYTWNNIKVHGSWTMEIGKLVKSLYVLKQVPKQWHKKFAKNILSNSFIINECDKCIYTKSKSNKYVIVCLYIDEMLIMVNNS